VHPDLLTNRPKVHGAARSRRKTLLGYASDRGLRPHVSRFQLRIDALDNATF
jgi:hypothetical protein